MNVSSDRRLTQTVTSAKQQSSDRTSRSSSVGTRHAFIEPPIQVDGKLLSKDKMRTIRSRNLDSLQKSFLAFEPPKYTPSSRPASTSANRPSSLQEALNRRPSSRPSNSNPLPPLPSSSNGVSQRQSNASTGKRRTLLDSATDPDLIEAITRERRVSALLEIGHLQQKYSWITLPDDIESYTVAEIESFRDRLKLETDSQETSNFFSIGYFISASVLVFVLWKFFAYSHALSLGCILIGSFHKFKPMIVDLATKGNGKSFYTNMHPGLKLAIQFAITLGVSVFALWAVDRFISKNEDPNITKARVDQLEATITNFGRHPSDKSTGVDFNSLILSGLKAFSGAGNKTDDDPEPEVEEIEDESLTDML